MEYARSESIIELPHPSSYPTEFKFVGSKFDAIEISEVNIGDVPTVFGSAIFNGNPQHSCVKTTA